MDLAKLIEQKADELGFALFGITGPAPLEYYSIFENWLSRRSFGEMQYLDSPHSRTCRKNPSLLFSGCKSIIVVGLPYGHAKGTVTNLGKVALFAQQPDYHQTIKQKLNALFQYIHHKTNANTQGYVCCDTEPVLEKGLAQRAGLGWIGKNSLLLNQKWGSLFNLGELFLNIELPYSQIEVKDLCLNCNLCIQSCPTNCIESDRTLKADHCISYLTIEHRNSIPKELRPLMDAWIYGCDICQLICPWNQKIFQKMDIQIEKTQKYSEYGPIQGNQFLLENSGLSFMHKRNMRKKVLRNFSICLGNTHQQEAIQPLTKLFNERDAEIRGSVAWALGQILCPQSKELLIQQLKIEGEPAVIEEINQSLQKLN